MRFRERRANVPYRRCNHNSAQRVFHFCTHHNNKWNEEADKLANSGRLHGPWPRRSRHRPSGVRTERTDVGRARFLFLAMSTPPRRRSRLASASIAAPSPDEVDALAARGNQERSSSTPGRISSAARAPPACRVGRWRACGTLLLPLSLRCTASLSTPPASASSTSFSIRVTRHPWSASTDAVKSPAKEDPRTTAWLR